MRVLGIDPGLTRCGLGMVDGVPGHKPFVLAVDVVRTSPAEETGARLAVLERTFEEWVQRYHPAAVAVERVFAQHNVGTVMGTAQAAGIALLVAARHGIPAALHTPSEVKAAITGSGRAGKDQVGAMVARILQIPEVPKPADAADALALAICHVWRGSSTDRLDQARQAAAGVAARQQRAYAQARTTQARPTQARPKGART